MVSSVSTRIDGLYAANDGGALTDSGVSSPPVGPGSAGGPVGRAFAGSSTPKPARSCVRHGARRLLRPGCLSGAGGELWLKLITGPLQLLGPDDQPSGVTLLPATFEAIAFAPCSSIG